MNNLNRFLPILDRGRNYRRADLGPDLTAGLTVGAMLVPQGMAYAQLAGLPAEIGLYSVTLPLIVYAFFGTSRQLAGGGLAGDRDRAGPDSRTGHGGVHEGRRAAGSAGRPGQRRSERAG